VESDTAPDAIYQGRFFCEGKLRDLEVAVAQGIIVKIGKDLRNAPRVKLDGAIIPAGFDPHVHFRDPGETWKEDFGTGTESAIYGGTTTVLDMPNNLRAITDYSRFEEKLAAVSGKAKCDFGLYSMYTGQNTALIDRRSCGLKIYLGGSTNAVPEVSSLETKSGELESFGKPVVFHGEDAACLERHRLPFEGSLFDHDRARPVDCELASASVVEKLSVKRKIMAHVSSSSTLGVLTSTVTEVTPHHLLLNNSMDLGSWGKCNPPLRSKEEQERLFQSYLDAKVTYIGSDHAPHTEEEKENFDQAPSGITGVETRVPLLLALFANKILSLERLVESTSSAPARMFGIRKGQIKEGYYFDVMSFRPSEIRRINEDKLHSLCPVSPFNGFTAVFPSDVFVSGNRVLERGELIEGYRGRFLY